MFGGIIDTLHEGTDFLEQAVDKSKDIVVNTAKAGASTVVNTANSGVDLAGEIVDQGVGVVGSTFDSLTSSIWSIPAKAIAAFIRQNLETTLITVLNNKHSIPINQVLHIAEQLDTGSIAKQVVASIDFDSFAHILHDGLDFNRQLGLVRVVLGRAISQTLKATGEIPVEFVDEIAGTLSSEMGANILSLLLAVTLL